MFGKDKISRNDFRFQFIAFSKMERKKIEGFIAEYS